MFSSRPQPWGCSTQSFSSSKTKFAQGNGCSLIGYHQMCFGTKLRSPLYCGCSKFNDMLSDETLGNTPFKVGCAWPEEGRVPKGRLSVFHQTPTDSAVPSGLIRSPNHDPSLKESANLGFPFGKSAAAFVRFFKLKSLWNSNRNVRSPVCKPNVTSNLTVSTKVSASPNRPSL